MNIEKKNRTHGNNMEIINSLIRIEANEHRNGINNESKIIDHLFSDFQMNRMVNGFNLENRNILESFKPKLSLMSMALTNFGLDEFVISNYFEYKNEL